ncbi:DJ-1/PfpI family protein [Tissierella creatinini]|nr:DJ-1/PfpI family protein [Tissierella creatinini]TJX67197.1 DJ-1/PfpI family protein [Soehngenia saccharolytica]
MKILLFLAEGFEEVEAFTVVDYLRRKNIVVDTIAITDNKEVRGSHNIIVRADKTINEIGDLKDYYGVVIPGGMPGASNLKDDIRVIDIVKEMNESRRLVAAICAGPIVLEKAGIIRGRNITSYPSFNKAFPKSNYIEENVVRDKNIITSRGPALAVDFTIEIIKYLLGDERAEELKQNILYK